MKKYTLFLGIGFLIATFMIVPIEKTDAQVKFGIKGGVNFSDMKYEPQDQTSGIPDTKSLTSYHVGVIADVPLLSVLSIQPGVMLNSIGAKVEKNGNNAGYTAKINPLYVDVPVNILFKPQIGTGTKFYVGVGPYIGFGVGGKATVEGNVGDVNGSIDHDLKFGNSSDDDLKSTDIGGNVLAGFEFNNGLLIGAQYGMSFTNNAPEGENSDNKILKNKVLSISVGYLF